MTTLSYLKHLIKGHLIGFAPDWVFHVLWKRYTYFAQASSLRKIAGYRKKISQPDTAKRILVFSPRWWGVHTGWECTIAHALLQKGNIVALTACGKCVPVCEAMTQGTTGREICGSCPKMFEAFSRKSGIPVLTLANFVDKARKLDIIKKVAALCEKEMFIFSHNGFNISEIIGCSMARQFRALNWERTQENLHLYRQYLTAASILSEIIPRLFDEFKPDSILLANGKFHAEAIVLEEARRRGVHVTTYERGNIRDTLTFAVDRPTVPLDFSVGWKLYGEKPLCEKERERLHIYLDKRKVVGNGMIPFYDATINEDEKTLIDELKVDSTRKVYVLFTNTIWDSAVYKEDKTFPNMFEWIERAVHHFFSHPERHLIIRVHPAEVRVHWQQTREKVVDFLKRRFPDLPENVSVVPPESNVSSYALMKIADAGLVYSSTVGIEMSLLGKPVITAANSNYGNKGFTYDANSPEEFDRLLETLPLEIEMKRREKAEILAYMMYFQYMIPFPFIHERPEHWNFSFIIPKFSEIPTAEMDRICKGIINGEPIFLER